MVGAANLALRSECRLSEPSSGHAVICTHVRVSLGHAKHEVTVCAVYVTSPLTMTESWLRSKDAARE